MNGPEASGPQLTFGGHLEVLRRMLFRILAVTGLLAPAVFACKETAVALGVRVHPVRLIERAAHAAGWAGFTLGEFRVDLIATDLSSQFMSHVSTACVLGLLGASPYVLYELFRFVSPALYENERRMALPVVLVVYALFLLGVLTSYYVLFPVSFRFLGTYSVSERVHSAITLDSYISTFATLTFVLGLVFQLPVAACLLAKAGMVSSRLLSHYRRHALLLVFVLSAVITPPDIMTLLLVALPLYLLYEVSIRVVRWVE